MSSRIVRNSVVLVVLAVFGLAVLWTFMVEGNPTPAYTYSQLLADAKGLAYASRLAAFERWASLRMAEAIEKFEVAASNAARAGNQYLEDDARSRIAKAHANGPTPLPETIQRLEQLIREYAGRPVALAGIRVALARALAKHGDIEAAR